MTRYSRGIVSALVMSAHVFAGATVARAKTDFEIYMKRCGGCHGPNVKRLAQSTLHRRGEKILTRDRTIELRKFLNRHGRSTTAEADRIYVLLWQHLASDGQ